LKSTRCCGKILPVIDGFVRCPTCRAKLMQVRQDTRAEKLIIYCRRCKTEYSVDIKMGQCFESRGQ